MVGWLHGFITIIRLNCYSNKKSTDYLSGKSIQKIEKQQQQMVLDSFATYFGQQTFDSLYEKYTQLIESKRGINLNVLTNMVIRGVYGMALPFIFKDQERKVEFLRVFENSIRQLDTI